MSSSLVALLAARVEGLVGPSRDFGVPWGTLALVLALVALLMLAIRLMGTLAARALDDESRSEPSTRPLSVNTLSSAAIVSEGPAPSALANIERRTVVIIAAAVAASEGIRARIVDIRRVQGGNISSQQAWSMEGRREIYLSHRIR